MPIFVSYSRRDSAFVDRLVTQLIYHKVNVWLDRWEIHVGDSLVSKVQDAIAGASALLVVLSQASVESEWCKREINSGFMRELDERRVVLLPVLVEDCRVPLFIREKAYADFRTDFDAGLQTILDAIARVVNANTGRIDELEYHADWSLDWGEVEGRAMLRYTIVEHARDQPYSVLAQVIVEADYEATRAYNAMIRMSSMDAAHKVITRFVVDTVNKPEELSLLLEDQFEQVREFGFSDGYGEFFVTVSARRLGADTGRSVIFRVGKQLSEMLRHMDEVTFQPRDSA